MPGPGEPSAFLREAARGHNAIREAALERRWAADMRRSYRDDFIEFQQSGSYTPWSQPVKADLSAAVERAVTSIGVARQLAILENRLPPRHWKRPVPSDVVLKAATNLSRFGSTGSLALLAEEDGTRSTLAASGTGTLSTAQLELLDSVRATVHNKGMDLGSHLADLERAVRIEVSKEAGEPFDHSATWEGMKFALRFADIRTALDAWYTALDSPTQLQQPETLAGLAGRRRPQQTAGTAPRCASPGQRDAPGGGG